ncbi:MAG: hypothetical protein WCV99_23225, partial [Sterolibacterium sp.]
PTLGPFLFQVKFVEHANAAGARPVPALKNAVGAEVAKQRKSRHPVRGRPSPRHYVFVTNVPLSPATRTWIGEQIGSVYPDCVVHTWGGKDLGDILHRHPNLCRAYPEILSLRNLDTLLGEVVNRDILNRSADALAFARDLAPAFVATATYFRAFEVLGKHHFVVLDGPPEMGKTAIARMVGLAQVAVDWEAFECQGPQDIDRVYVHDRQQVFIADDAFGRTEYDPLKGYAWEHAIPRLLHRLDGKHWLIWTTRKHILERALSTIDLQAPARKFPDPGEVVVTASDLSVEEKALILYRHARARRIGAMERNLVKAQAKAIVQSQHFTPERIRRLCEEKLAELCASELKSTDVANAVQEAINNPTASMQKAYRNLPETYRWLLIAKLGQHGYTVPLLHEAYQSYMGPVASSDFRRRLDDLDGTFLRRTEDVFESDPDGLIDWVHPSFRDLVIDELADDLQLQERYWRGADSHGIAIALSQSGGASGDRRWPLLGHQQCWPWFGDCCERLASSSGQFGVRQLMDYLTEAWKQEDITQDERNLLLPVYSRVLQAVATRWTTDLRDASESTVKVFVELCSLSGIGAPMPDLAPIFETVLINLEVMAYQELVQDPDELDQFLRVAVLLTDYQPSWFSVPLNAVRLERALRLIETAVEGELGWQPYGERADVISGQVENLRAISGALRSIQRFLDANDLPKLAGNMADRCDSSADTLGTKAAEAEQHEESMPTRAGGKDVEPFNIQAFFADL